jgi:hypothetical protein
VVALVSLVLALLFAVLLYYEESLVSPNIQEALQAELRPGLYQVAVQAVLDEAQFFSSWAVGLIVAGWFVTLQPTNDITTTEAVQFLLVCAAGLLVLFLGQLLNQVVIQSIALNQDPLANPKTSAFLTYQYRALLAEALVVAGSIVKRVH